MKERLKWTLTFSGERDFDVADLEFDEGVAVVAEQISSDPLKFLADLDEECDMEIEVDAPEAAAVEGEIEE
jgi:hypothetical protein